MSDKINIVLLAAGKGTRLNIDIAKPLCPANGKTLVDYVIEELAEIEIEKKLYVVVGHKAENVETHICENFPNLDKKFILQKEQLGTGHAVKTFLDESPEAKDAEFTIVVCADTPLIKKNTYDQLINKIKNDDLQAVCATFKLANPTGYGRIVHADKGFKIIEEKDASDEIKKINEVNSGLYIFKTEHINSYINNLNKENNSNEYYLTDLVEPGLDVATLCYKDSLEFTGVNNLIQLEQIEKELRRRKLEELQLSGVRFINSDSVYIEQTVRIERECTIYPNVVLMGKTSIGQHSIIESGTTIKNSTVAANSIIKSNSYLEGAMVGERSAIGPMARLREGSVIGEACKIGNFVETKKVNFENGVKVSHLSYLGDADIGENTNIGCGFVTCNYDGANKHKTTIGKNSFIGSDCQVVAPIKIGSDAYIGSGSTINKDVPDGAFAIARERQTTKENMAKIFIKKKE